MKKLMLYLMIGQLLIAALVIPSCSKLDNPTSVAFSSQANIVRLKAWFEGVWKSKENTNDVNARSSPWAHDTSFVQNNYANLTLDWRFTKVHQDGDTTYTEVPGTLRDTLEFKIGASDSLSLQAQLSDSIYRQRSQSKIVMVFKEAPGQEIYAEAVTFIADYEFTKTDYQRFISNISYFDLVGYTGLVMYHDRAGALLRSFEYMKGQIINTVRCVEMRGLDPAPDNRVHLDKCYEVLTWERQCITTYTQYGSSTECGEWYLVGSYMMGACFNEGSGGGTSAPPAYDPISEDGLSCGSFSFAPTADNWQEAGVNGLRVNIVWLGGNHSGFDIHVTLGAPIVFGMPLKRGSTIYSPGKAAENAAEAVNNAIAMTAQLLKYEPYRPSDAAIEAMFRRWVNIFMGNYAGTAGRTGSKSPLIQFRNAQYTLFGHGDCE